MLKIRREPGVVLYYFGSWFLNAIKIRLFSLVGILAVYTLWFTAHEASLRHALYWIGLGLASSIGLGTGLHTFVLFLGPLVAKTTLTAHACSSIHFESVGPDAFACPLVTSNMNDISMWVIAWKLKSEALLWGLGTALGECPPYFVSRAAALNSSENTVTPIESILKKLPNERNWFEKAQVVIYAIVQRGGFFGILLCASVPNPLFDLAGIICGRFGIPFYTFLSAVVIGKALIKSPMQCLFIILLFSNDVIEPMLIWAKLHIPILYEYATPLLKKQSDSLQGNDVESLSPFMVHFTRTWNLILTAMVLYFCLSIVESLATSRYQS